MSKVTIVSTVTYAIEVDIPLFFLVDEKQFAASHAKEHERSFREGLPAGTELLDVKASAVVVASRPK
ncbi:hypothetical protein OG923_12725 [Streptomyces halstedii]|uniref:hypothetical protein n=1 Tax=Streptomyces halstedii TaxID=1944 RepID=UPI0032440A0E